jgi:hypothetical protein
MTKTRQPWQVAEFDSAERLRAAADRLAARGARIVEACTPFEVPGLRGVEVRRRTGIPRAAFVGGLAGAIAGYGIQWYVDAWSYPLNIGGRPNDAIPPYVFVTFETLVLGAAFAIVGAFVYLLGLPRYYHPLWEVPGFERASSDRFFLVVERDPAQDLFEGLSPLRVVDLEARR